MKKMILAAALLGPAWPAFAVELPLMFGDGMVLQRERAIAVWGQAAPDAEVRVSLDGLAASVVADGKGAWRAELAAHAAGGPYTLRIEESGAATTVLSDVWVGDVWLASGQSNMEWPLAQSERGQADVAAANDPQIRHFRIPKSWAGTPQAQLQGGRWIAATPDTAGAFSAVGYYFAKALRERTELPIGIIDASWGGSSIEAWMDAATQGMDVAEVARIDAAMQARDEAALKQTREHLAQWPDLPVDDADWQQPDLDEQHWTTLSAPALWEKQGWDGMDGVAWYRHDFTLSADEATRDLVVGLGRIDDSDTTWVNGVPVGETRMGYNQRRVYTVPASALRVGRNVIAIRVTDTGGGGGMDGQPDELYWQPEGGSPSSLTGEWRFRVAQATVSAESNKNQRPTLLYNAMIHPLRDVGLRGVIWYQGESNAFATPNARAYRGQFSAMIGQWRAQFAQLELPFLWVQLASFHTGTDAGLDSPWSVLRESQSATLRLPATAQVVSIDIGDAADIHPRNKHDVGARLALAARHVAYGEDIVYHGPVLREASFEAQEARLQFDTGASALQARGAARELIGFELAGADRVFHPAQARIEGEQLRVRSADVPAPVAVRYAWRDDAGQANLVNDAGLPASPFRSDDW